MSDYGLKECKDIVNEIFAVSDNPQPKLAIIKALREAYRAGELAPCPGDPNLLQDLQTLSYENRDLREENKALTRALAVLAKQLKD